ncbi:SUKH-4 family immunity protein [Actinomadura rupiterrae]|uniref:SUKH-4 family immunity protein n=1 Tax=Actinomadura rupiterrae TaxID=559627 RepID=UPI0020A48A82|nr:SUKH-4 family immunity protein [Actinomadura rupiterrae]MCP2343641.1 hypothetical protein [Actinomadura rupiterrae]
MISFEDMLAQWGEDGLLYIPVDLLERIRFDPATLSPKAAIPGEVPLLLDAYIDGDIKLFGVLEVQVGADEPLGLIALGRVPDDEAMYYCLNGDSGQVLLLTADEPAGLELVNSTLAHFVEFLFRVDRLIRADQGKTTRAVPAGRLHAELAELDPAAFEDPESWWSIAFAQLEGRL